MGDPRTRRKIWSIIRHACRSRDATVILTTHSMEEAAQLGDRIVIMTEGVLSCVGTADHLTSKFADGMHLTFTLENANCTEQEVRSTVEAIAEVIPGATHLSHSIGAVHHMHVPISGAPLSSLFHAMQGLEVAHGISNWVISHTTLEDVFINLANGGHGVAGDQQQTSERDYETEDYDDYELY